MDFKNIFSRILKKKKPEHIYLDDYVLSRTAPIVPSKEALEAEIRRGEELFGSRKSKHTFNVDAKILKSVLCKLFV